MTVEKLIAEYRKHNPDGHYFDRSTLRFFGERVDEMEIIPLAGGGVIVDRYGVPHEVWCLKSIAHNAPVGTGLHYTYFDKKTFEEVEPKWRDSLYE